MASENTVFDLTMPNRILSYPKIVQESAETKYKTKFCDFVSAESNLSYQKIVKVENNAKPKACL